MYKNAHRIAQWYIKNTASTKIYAKGRTFRRWSRRRSTILRLALRNQHAEDAARVRAVDHEIPNTAAEENRARRRADFLKEEARVRKIYEELVSSNRRRREVVQNQLTHPTSKKPLRLSLP